MTTPDQGAGLPEVPAELADEWWVMALEPPGDLSQNIARQAIAWAAPTLRQQGADAKLEAMLAELKAMHLPDGYADRLRDACRPKPLSQAEQALQALDSFEGFTGSLQEVDTIRRALERLRELERGDG